MPKYHKGITYPIESRPGVSCGNRNALVAEASINGHENAVTLDLFGRTGAKLAGLYNLTPENARELAKTLLLAADAVDPRRGEGLDALIGGIRITGVDRLRRVIAVERVKASPGVVAVPGVEDDDWRVEEN